MVMPQFLYRLLYTAEIRSGVYLHLDDLPVLLQSCICACANMHVQNQNRQEQEKATEENSEKDEQIDCCGRLRVIDEKRGIVHTGSGNNHVEELRAQIKLRGRYYYHCFAR